MTDSIFKHLEEQLHRLQEAFQKELNAFDKEKTFPALERLRALYLGRKGKMTEIVKMLQEISADERAEFGARINAAKKFIQEELTKREGVKDDLAGEADIDITIPGKKCTAGRLHPVNQMVRQIFTIFQSLNFDIIQGPEIENEYYNFEALNVHTGHPARDMQDTFFLPHKLLLRTQTTAVSAREMELRKPPLRLVSVGKTYRRDSDITHTPMFHQFDGVMVAENIHMGHLKALIQHVMERLMEKKLKIRFRISYFPFVEPGAEFDVSCTICDQKGCPTCKYTGWLEIGGCGMLHPNVLKNAGYDSEAVQGLAFGFGIERPFMIKHKIPDLRLFFKNDIRFLEQF